MFIWPSASFHSSLMNVKPFSLSFLICGHSCKTKEIPAFRIHWFNPHKGIHVSSISWLSVPDFSCSLNDLCVKYETDPAADEVAASFWLSFSWRCCHGEPPSSASHPIWVSCAQSMGLVWSLRGLRICCCRLSWWEEGEKTFSSVDLESPKDEKKNDSLC